MSKILKYVLSKNEIIRSATNSYIDDILLDDNKVSANKLVDHLNKYGLVTKHPETIDGGAALGLRLHRDERGELLFSRGNIIPETTQNVTKKELFSICGKLTGHYHIASWLRIACSYIKRMASCKSWKNVVDRKISELLQDVVDRVKREDPVNRKW